MKWSGGGAQHSIPKKQAPPQSQRLRASDYHFSSTLWGCINGYFWLFWKNIGSWTRIWHFSNSRANVFLFIAHPKSLSIFKFFTLSKFCWNYIRFHVESINYLFASYITLVLKNYYDFHTYTYTMPFLKYRWFHIHVHCPYFNKVLHKI